MTKEQYLNDRIAELRTLLADGLEQNKIEVTEKSERLIQSFLENTISGYKAINEKSYFDKELDKIDNGWGAAGERLGHDNIGGHEVVKPVDWVPSMDEKYYVIDKGNIIQVKAGCLDHRRPGFPTAALAQQYLDSQKPVERWKPEVGETYWIVTEKGTPYSTVWNEDFFTKSCFDFGNVFKSEPEAFAARERVKKALLG